MIKMHKRVNAWICLLLIVTFVTMIIFPRPLYAQRGLNLPDPGMLINPSNAFHPTIIEGLTVYPDNPLKFRFIFKKGMDGLEGQNFSDEATKLVKYFLACLTIPEEEQWVNLSPYEKDRIIPKSLEMTDIGRDLLAQDYLLKQATASFLYPESELGETFWEKIYSRANSLFKATDIEVNTFNKVWIVPENAVVYEHENSVFVVKNHLKVMLEEDYLALKHNVKDQAHPRSTAEENADEKPSTILRAVILPAIEKEVNEGKHFARLRQIYNSMLLATWYKRTLRETLLGKVYTDKNKVKGIDIKDKNIKQKIYNQYLEAFQEGVYNYIKEEYDPSRQDTILRKYFAGGINGFWGRRMTRIGPNYDGSASEEFFQPQRMDFQNAPDAQKTHEAVDVILYEEVSEYGNSKKIAIAKTAQEVSAYILQTTQPGEKLNLAIILRNTSVAGFENLEEILDELPIVIESSEGGWVRVNSLGAAGVGSIAKDSENPPTVKEQKQSSSPEDPPSPKISSSTSQKGEEKTESKHNWRKWMRIAVKGSFSITLILMLFHAIVYSGAIPMGSIRTSQVNSQEILYAQPGTSKNFVTMPGIPSVGYGQMSLIASGIGGHALRLEYDPVSEEESSRDIAAFENPVDFTGAKLIVKAKGAQPGQKVFIQFLDKSLPEKSVQESSVEIITSHHYRKTVFDLNSIVKKVNLATIYGVDLHYGRKIDVSSYPIEVNPSGSTIDLMELKVVFPNGTILDLLKDWLIQAELHAMLVRAQQAQDQGSLNAAKVQSEKIVKKIQELHQQSQLTNILKLAPMYNESFDALIYKLMRLRKSLGMLKWDYGNDFINAIVLLWDLLETQTDITELIREHRISGILYVLDKNLTEYQPLASGRAQRAAVVYFKGNNFFPYSVKVGNLIKMSGNPKHIVLRNGLGTLIHEVEHIKQMEHAAFWGIPGTNYYMGAFDSPSWEREAYVEQNRYLSQITGIDISEWQKINYFHDGYKFFTFLNRTGGAIGAFFLLLAIFLTIKNKIFNEKFENLLKKLQNAKRTTLEAYFPNIAKYVNIQDLDMPVIILDHETFSFFYGEEMPVAIRSKPKGKIKRKNRPLADAVFQSSQHVLIINEQALNGLHARSIRANLVNELMLFKKSLDPENQEIFDSLPSLSPEEYFGRRSVRHAVKTTFRYLRDEEGANTLKQALNFSGQTNETMEAKELRILESIWEESLSSWKSLSGHQQTTDQALLVKPDSLLKNTPDRVGGIDLNPASLNLKIKRDGKGVALPMTKQSIEKLNIEGFIPVIINFEPVSLPMLLGVVQEKALSNNI